MHDDAESPDKDGPLSPIQRIIRYPIHQSENQTDEEPDRDMLNPDTERRLVNR
mgnify:CR=1 FL=1